MAYVYDNDYRLKSETITSDPGSNNGAESYNYDVVGNRTSLSSTIPALPGSITYSYDDDDRLSTDSYDANGNTIKSAGIANTYDFENRILTHGAVTYVYDGDGNRVSETVGGTTTKYLVDDLNPTALPQVLDEIVNGSVTRTYVYGAIRLAEDQISGGTVTPSFYGYDGHGNVRFLANASGTVTDTYDYDAFGMSIKINGMTPNPYFYSGERLDAGTGLYDLRARYYNQETGRFWARDPEGGVLCTPLTLNPYIYTWADPVNQIDPTGRDVAVPMPRPTGGTEYVGLLAALTIAALQSLPQVAHGVSCIFEATGTGIHAVYENLRNGTNPFNIEKVGECELEPKPTCEKQFPKLIPVSQLPWFYEFRNEDAAFAGLSAYHAKKLRKTTDAYATTGPCPIEGRYNPGWHINTNFVKDGGYAGALVGCPACDDSSGEAIPTERWGFIPEE